MAFALLAAMAGAWFRDKSFGLLSLAGMAALAGAGFVAINDQPLAPVQIFQGAMVVDAFGVFAKALIGLFRGGDAGDWARLIFRRRGTGASNTRSWLCLPCSACS